MVYPFPEVQLHYFGEFVYFENMFLPQEIDAILKLWDDGHTKDAVMSTGGDENKQELRSSTVQFLPYETQGAKNTQWLYDKLAGLVIQMNMQHFGFDLIGFKETLQLTQYGSGDHFNWHMDFGPSEISHRKLSITVQLSNPDDYQGGDLLFRINDREVPAPRTQGTVVVFPSFVHHKVAPITAGVRRSIVGWASGQPYR